MNKLELLEEKIKLLLQLDMHKNNSKELLEKIKKEYPYLIDERLNSKKK